MRPAMSMTPRTMAGACGSGVMATARMARSTRSSGRAKVRSSMAKASSEFIVRSVGLLTCSV